MTVLKPRQRRIIFDRKNSSLRFENIMDGDSHEILSCVPEVSFVTDFEAPDLRNLSRIELQLFPSLTSLTVLSYSMEMATIISELLSKLRSFSHDAWKITEGKLALRKLLHLPLLTQLLTRNYPIRELHLGVCCPVVMQLLSPTLNKITIQCVVPPETLQTFLINCKELKSFTMGLIQANLSWLDIMEMLSVSRCRETLTFFSCAEEQQLPNSYETRSHCVRNFQLLESFLFHSVSGYFKFPEPVVNVLSSLPNLRNVTYYSLLDRKTLNLDYITENNLESCLHLIRDEWWHTAETHKRLSVATLNMLTSRVSPFSLITTDATLNQ